MTQEERKEFLKTLHMAVQNLQDESALYTFEYCIFYWKDPCWGKEELTESDYERVASSENTFYEALKIFINIIPIICRYIYR